MEVELIKEFEDGSATFSIDLNPEESNMLILFGIRIALEKAAQAGKDLFYDSSEANNSRD